MDRSQAIDQLLAWAAHDDNIRAVVATGSFAGGTMDPYSDLDIELYVDEPAHLLDQNEWYRQFGSVLVVEALENEGWNPTRLVYYAGGKIDFTIIATSLLQRGVEFVRPFRVLLDKDSRGEAFQSVPLPATQPPTGEEFLARVNQFYAALIMWAKQLARGDVWAAKIRDWESKEQLLRILEWDHKSRRGWSYDTWHLGIRMQEWVDPGLLPALAATWCSADAEESRQAIRSSLAIFDALSSRTAQVLGYPQFDSTSVRDEVEQLLKASPTSD